MEGLDERTLVRTYVKVVQVVPLYGLYTWVIPPRIGVGGWEDSTTGWPAG